MTIVAKKPSHLFVIGAADFERCFEDMPDVRPVRDRALRRLSLSASICTIRSSKRHR